MTHSTTDSSIPGGGLQYSRMPGHWLLARMGKRVLRPGGIELTLRMLDALGIRPTDDVVEFAPGLGATARVTLERGPRSYVGIERDEDAARHVRRYLTGESRRCLVGRAEETRLGDGSASVIYGEAMLTMQAPARKNAIVAEAARVLRTGGRYGVHELALTPDDLPEAVKSDIQKALSEAIHVGARPLTAKEWRAVLAAHGFVVETQINAPMHLLEPRRFVRDEGWPRVLRFLWNVARTPAARQRIRTMRATFRRYAEHLTATAIVGVSAGAALAAISTIALGDTALAFWPAVFGVHALPVAAFLGGLATTLLLVLVANRSGGLLIGTLLLAGIAFGALANAGSGLIAYVSDDRELRDLTLWSLGSLSGANWDKVTAIVPFALLLAVFTPAMVRALNGLLLGEAEAFHLGISVERAKRILVTLTAAAVGAAVAVAGVIGFVGIVVPHFARLITGPDHRFVLPASALFGGVIVLTADVIARLIVQPAELPIGIVMAAIGAPVFLHLVIRRGI